MRVAMMMMALAVLAAPVLSQVPGSFGAQRPANLLMEHLFSPGGFNSELRTPTDAPPTGVPRVCMASGCAPYTVISREPTYERRRYERMAVVVSSDSTGWMSPMVNYFNIKHYCEEALNYQNVTVRMMFPMLTALKASRAHMIMMPLPAAYQAAPPTPIMRSVQIKYLPTMEVLVKPHQSLAFGAGNEKAVAHFRLSVSRTEVLASQAAFVADYVPAYEFFNRRSEIWLIAKYPRRAPSPIFPGF